MRLALAALAIAALAAGAAVGASHEPAAAVPAVALTVRYDAGPSRAETRSTLRCTTSTATGTGRLRDLAVRACRIARERRTRLHGPRPADEICTDIFGGPQVARVTGTVGGTRVARRFTRADGCRIAEWDALVPLLPRTRGAQGP